MFLVYVQYTIDDDIDLTCISYISIYILYVLDLERTQSSALDQKHMGYHRTSFD